MNTPFVQIYNTFLNKITDFYVYDLSDCEVESFCYKLLMAALPKINIIENDLSYNIDENCFNAELLPIEIEIIAIQMVAEWIEPQLNNMLLLKQFVGTKDEKFFAQSNHIKQLEDLLQLQEQKARRLRRDYRYRNTDLSNI